MQPSLMGQRHRRLHRHTETDTSTVTQTDRHKQIGSPIEGQLNSWAGVQTDRGIEIQTSERKDRQSSRQTDRQIDTHTNIDGLKHRKR